MTNLNQEVVASMKHAESYVVRREIYQSSCTDEVGEVTLNSGSEQWLELVHAWEIALQLALTGQSKIIQSMHECYFGICVNPTPAQLNDVDELWVSEKQARGAMDDFISERFG